ncbi:hypothetical protein Mag101_07880 [Microbulbifer agarilyticus]|uniref:CD-NTase-associated protein 15 domain-containing protein n=1 Tax=Microbulbifer agarilyticus TaxID=260552 RepID=A0A1Q2M4E5_9GAMM|nr:hypothetical protein [Microbulbifer agarilyticus]AQQ67571.1 hypothetical protein Mag101_07880 [Microbulbifer agarilyticus]
MINLLPVGRVISFVAVAYAAVSCLILWVIYDEATSFFNAITIATSGSIFLNLLLFIIFYMAWEKLWNKYPILNHLLFPNLNGKWEMLIHWEWEGKRGVSHARAVIKQSFLTLGMDVEAEDSDSQTLLAKPKRDSETGRAELYYVFLTTPKNKGSAGAQEPYKGTAILKLSLQDDGQLQGNYFTSRKTVGHYELTRISV